MPFCRDDAVQQLEERIIVPDDTKILLKKVGSLATTPSTHSGKGSKLKRIRFSLPHATLEKSDDSEGDEDDEEKKMKKRGKRSRRKGSDDEEEFTLDAAEAELDREDDDEVEEDGDAGHGNGCSQCGTLTAKKLHDDEETGDLLCTLCHRSRGGTAAAAAAAGTSGATATASCGKACYHCRNDEVSKLHSHKASGGWECGTCRRYRTSHNGELRPARLFNRRMRARTASPATSGANSGGTTPLTIATPLNYNTNQHNTQQQQRQVQNRMAALVPAQNGSHANRYASAQKRPLRLRERVFSQSTQVIKTCSIVNKGSFTMYNMKNNYTMQALAYGANQVAIEILAAEKKEEGRGNTAAWGDFRRQIIEQVFSSSSS